MKGHVTVVIPLYNKQTFIEQTLQSVLSQSYKNLDCVIVDDGSTDDSFTIAQRFIKENRLQWTLVSQQNSGQTKARNHGIRLAQGEFLAFLDSDDLWTPNKIQLQVAALEAHPKSVLVLNAYAIFDEKGAIPRIVRHRNSRKMNSQWLDMRGFGGGLESLGLVRRRVFDDIGFFDETLSTSSGLDLSLRLEQAGEIILLKEVGLYYRISPGQWHANPKALKQDLRVLSAKHLTSSLESTSKFQEAYFFWTAARLNGRFAFIKAFMVEVIALDFYRLRMLESLLMRNLHSRALGWAERRMSISFLKEVSMKGSLTP